MAPMTRRGWVQCSRCAGEGLLPGYETSDKPPVRCPDCVGGEVPGDELVAVCAFGPDGEDFNAARYALIAARRWEEQ